MKQFYSKTLTNSVMIIITLLFGFTMRGQTTLAPGDILFTSFDTSPLAGAGDGFSFVTLVQLNSGTTISFTDRGYTGSGWQPTGGTESTITWVSNGTISANTEVYIIGLTANNYVSSTSTSTANGTVTLTEGSSTNGLSLANVGESIIAFQGGSGSVSAGGVTLIAGINTFYTASTTTAGWNIGSTFPNPNASLMPPGLVGGTNAFYTGAVTGTTSPAAGKFNCTGVPTTTAANVRTAVMTVGNWTLHATADQGEYSGCTFISSNPVINPHPSNSTICSGGNTTFSITASNATGYQWQVSTNSGGSYSDLSNTGVYSNTTTNTLTLTGATAGMNGYMYKCVASNGSGSTTSNAATLTVNSAPSITVQPSASTICAGTNATFSVTASNATGYQWQVDQGAGFNSISNGAPYSGANTATLTITGVTAGLSGYIYRVVVTGSCTPNATSNNAALTVNSAPAITGQPSASTICAGANTTFSATASNATGYQWQVDQGAGFNSISNNATYSGATTATLTITGATAGLSGYLYRVVATGNCTPNATSNNAALTVNSAPAITSQPSASTICAGANTTFTATAANATGYQWQVDQGAGFNSISNGAPYSGTNTATLTITGATAGLSGYIYRVVVTGNCTPTATSNNAALTVNSAPAITAQPSASTICAGANTTFTATAANATGYQWQVDQGAGFNTISNNSTYSGATTATLTITGATAGLNGYLYRVVATGSCSPNATSNSAALTVNSAPAITAQPSASTICAGANTTFTATAANATGYQWQVDQGAGFTSISNGAPYSGATTATLTITGATAGLSGYLYRVIATGNCTPVATSNSAALTVNSAPAITAQPSVSTICAGANTTFSATASNVTGYQWQVNQGLGFSNITNGGVYSGATTATLTITGATSGLNGYQYRVVATGSCTPAATSASATLNVGNLSATTIQTDIACYGGSTGALSVTVSGGATPYAYLWSNGATSSNITGLAAGPYSVTVTDGNNCQITRNFVIVQPAAALTTTAGTVSNVSCNGGSNGSAQVIVSGGTPGYSYSWSPSGGTNATATGLAAGTYTVTVTDANNCQTTRDFTITQPTAIVASAASQTNVSCNGGANGSATVAVTGGTPFYTYSWAPTGGTAATASGLVAGTYTVTVTDANNCQTTQSFTITQPTELISTISKTDVLCNGGATGTATVAPSGGNGAYTYAWSPSGGTAATASGLTVGNYSCLITDSKGCSITKNITINQPSALGATTSQTNATCSAGGDASVTPFGGVGGYTYLWTPGGATTQSVTGLSAGSHTCVITDANGCTITKNFVITTTNTLVAATFQTNLLCNGINTGSAGVIPSGAPGPYTYIWSPSGGNADTATNLAAGSYSVLITASNGCSITKNFTITQPIALMASAFAQTNVSCNGGNNGSATVAVTGGTGGYTYAWAPSGGTATTANGLAAGTYTVTVTDANFCQTTQSFTITQPAAIVASIGAQTNVSCNGGSNGSATVAVTGGTGAYTYAWAPSGGTAAMASGLAAGTYTVTVTDANNCQTTQSFTITQPTVLTATTSQTNLLCNGGTTGSATVTTSGGTGAYTYVWAPSGGTAATASGLVAGTYTCTITDANGCSIIKNFTLTQPTVLVASAAAQTNLSCNGGSNGSATVTATGGTTPYTYSWAPASGTSATITGKAAGTYVATVTDANGCTATQSFTITQPTALTATTTQTNVTCFGASNGSASVIVSGGTPAYTYSWAPSGGTAATATGLAAGNYTVTVTDANNCTITRNFTITGTSALTITPSQTNVTCNGAVNGTATVAVTGGTGTYTYAWSPSGGTAATASGLAPGNYSVTVTDGNGCIGSQSFTITQPAVLVLNGTSTNISCHGIANGVATVTPVGGTAPYTYSWAPSGATTPTITGLTGGNYTVTVTDANGCVKTRTFTIYEQTTIVVTSVKTDVLCHGAATGSATVSATGGVPNYTYAWSNGAGSPTVTGLSAGTYTCTVSDALGCSVVHTVTINSPEAISVNVTQTNISCSGNNDGSITVAVTGGVAPYTYSWIPATASTGPVANGLSVGNYSVTITDANGCTTVRNLSLTQPQPLAVTLTKTDVQCFGGNDGAAIAVVTGGTAPYTYTWTAPVGGTPDPENLVAGTYTVTITDANGCTFTGSITINQPLQLIVSNHPQNTVVTTGSNATYTATVINATAYQWEYSTNGTDWSNVVNGGSNPTYSGATTNVLTIIGIPKSYNGYHYRVLAVNASNCTIISNSALLTVNNDLLAVDDDFTETEILAGTGGIAGDVTANDFFNNLLVNDTDIVISVVDNDGLIGVTIDADGNLIVPSSANMGTYTITYSICDSGNLTNCSTAEAIVVVTELVGIDEIAKLELNLYPNPATTNLFIKIPGFENHRNMKLSIYDLNGRLIRQDFINSELQSIDVTGVESGIYLFRVTSDTSETTRRVVIDKKF